MHTPMKDPYLLKRVCRYCWNCAVVIDARLVVNSRQLHTGLLQQLRSQIQRYGPQIPICIHLPRLNMLFYRYRRGKLVIEIFNNN